MPARSRRPAAPTLRLPALLAGCLAIAACGGKDGDAAPGPGAGGPPPATVTTQVLAMRPFNDGLDALGTARARESVLVTAKVSETVARVHFESGDQVAAGAPLVSLTGGQQEAALAAAKATADEADALFRRQEQLVAQQLVSRASVDTQRATRDAARAQVEQIQANLGDRVIRAPFAGVLGMRMVSPGALVTPGTAIANLDAIDRVWVDFPVPEGQLANLATGQRLEGRSDAYPKRTFDGAVSTIDARVDEATRAVTVRGEFANADRALRPGMLVRVRLERAGRDALLVPEIAIVQVGRDTFAWRVRGDGTVEQAPIRVGTRRNGQAEVVEGLKAGERIVVDGTGKLRPGARIIDQATGTAPATASPQGPREG